MAGNFDVVFAHILQHFSLYLCTSQNRGIMVDYNCSAYRGFLHLVLVFVLSAVQVSRVSPLQGSILHVSDLVRII